MRARWLVLAIFILILPGTGRGQELSGLMLDAGPLKLNLYVSPRTATLFHVVDQLSEWNEFCHRQYGEYFSSLGDGYSDKDRDLLAKHTAIRRVRGSGGGLEQTFYMPLDLNLALRRGVQMGFLTEEQATVERVVLTQFAGRVEDLRKKEAKTLVAFAQRLLRERDNLREFATKLSRFCGGVEITVPVYLIANPADWNCGGGYNGGRLTLEIPRQFDVYPMFLHELMHAFLATQQDRMQKTVQGVEGLDFAGLNEGLAYALSPGILHTGAAGDPLASEVREDIQAQKPLTDNLTRFRRLGLALRPLLREALNDETQTLEMFLPRAVEAWCVVKALDLALGPASEEPKPPQGVAGQKTPSARSAGEAAPGSKEHKQITISQAYWFDDWLESHGYPDCAKGEKLPDSFGAQLLLHGEEWFNDVDRSQYKVFMIAADRDFVLKAPGQMDVWGHLSLNCLTVPQENIREIVLIIPPHEYRRMATGTPYTLHPVNSKPDHPWVVNPGVTITKKAELPAGRSKAFRKGMGR